MPQRTFNKELPQTSEILPVPVQDLRDGLGSFLFYLEPVSSRGDRLIKQEPGGSCSQKQMLSHRVNCRLETHRLTYCVTTHDIVPA